MWMTAGGEGGRVTRRLNLKRFPRPWAICRWQEVTMTAEPRWFHWAPSSVHNIVVIRKNMFCNVKLNLLMSQNGVMEQTIWTDFPQHFHSMWRRLVDRFRAHGSKPHVCGLIPYFFCLPRAWCPYLLLNDMYLQQTLAVCLWTEPSAEWLYSQEKRHVGEWLICLILS